jgi:hypothetical protein
VHFEESISVAEAGAAMQYSDRISSDRKKLPEMYKMFFLNPTLMTHFD